MELIWEIAVSAFLVLAGIFALVGAWGLVKLPSPMTRLHAPTKATTLGVGGVLIASMIWSIGSHGVLSFHELLITLFLFLTAPITANFIAKANLHRAAPPEDLPTLPEGQLWAHQSPGTDTSEAAFEDKETHRGG
ncbi:Na+/H+ antiporter subunit G [Phaeovulum vinaykumarii]|uniref:Multisubunit potassium/proton antiporter, PhaG subunit n=1 Tax=Phaeovulum vinaykumarii TaxID=407234 RepID=A0A1N7K1G7_9RHOB|nr:Na+/H+ antiporter subunit G [Phaeovulum vinaykumarii]SIS55366.1 multisubunit potassium/proton antiporter, PhaG subunit [Phaeovulum vinaykumarii]SOB92344.1 multisubunit potassium/proton antiporter PhaG subunit [Phaeovulum vinaykumarii]